MSSCRRVSSALALLAAASAARVPGSPFPVPSQGLNASRTLMVVDPSGLSRDDAFTLQALQGVLSKRTPRLARAAPGTPQELWLNVTRDVWSVALSHTSAAAPGALAGLVRTYAPELADGYVLCSLDDNSTNVAVAVAAALDVLVVTAANEALATGAGLRLAYDVRGRDTAWAVRTFNATAASRGFAYSRSVSTLQLPAEGEGCMSDYSIAAGALQWWADDVAQDLRARVLLDTYAPPFAVLGWGPDEAATVAAVSAAGGGVVASDLATNLDVFASFDVPRLAQRVAPALSLPPIDMFYPGVHTACFLMSDGDNVQWLLDGFVTDERWWGSADRGAVPLGWTLSATTADLAPAVPAHLYGTASPVDRFVAGASGGGYFYPDSVVRGDGSGPERLRNLTALAASLMAKVDLRIVNVIGQGNARALADAYLDHAGIDAVFWYDAKDYSGEHGRIKWSASRKPIIGGRFA